MRYLDTCICIEFLRGRLTRGIQLMRDSRPEEFQLPAIVVAELFYSAERSSDPGRQRKLAEAFVSAFEIAPFDAQAAREYARLRKVLASRGSLVDDRDLMIASTAIANHAVLVTNNVEDFALIPDFPVESWREIGL